MPLVTVILNSYNHAHYLRQAIDSVLGQTFADFELLVVDNGSSDESPSVIASYQGDRRVRPVLHSENRPITQRFNEAVDLAHGEFVSFLYSDDYYLPAKLERQVAEFARFDASYGVVYGPARGYNELTGVSWTYPPVAASGWVFRDLTLRAPRVCNIDMISPLTRRACLLRHRFNEEVFAEGEGIFLRISLTHRFAFVPEALAVVRDHAGNRGKAIKANCAMVEPVLARLRQDPALTPDQRPLVDRHEAILMRGYGWQAARLGEDSAFSRACFRRAWRVSRREALHPKTAAGIGLTLLPARARQAVNAVGHRLRRAPAHRVVVEGY